MKTKRLAITLAALFTIGLMGLGASEARASDPWGLGFRIGGTSFRLGHGGYGGAYYRGGYHGAYYRGGRGHHGHYDWHDTSHYDWHPGYYRRHGNHFHYTPGHWDFHRDGHWDFHHGGHHGHHHGH